MIPNFFVAVALDVPNEQLIFVTGRDTAEESREFAEKEYPGFPNFVFNILEQPGKLQHSFNLWLIDSGVSDEDRPQLFELLVSGLKGAFNIASEETDEKTCPKLKWL